MNKPITQGAYLARLARMGEAVYIQEDIDLRARYDDFCADEAAMTDLFPAFGVLRETLALDYPEAMCVAMGFYLDTSPHTLTPGELLARCRHLGGRSHARALGRLFLTEDGRAVLHPIAADFLTGDPPRLSRGLRLHIPDAEIDPPPQIETPLYALYDELIRLIDGCTAGTLPFPLAIALCGERGSGRRSLVRRICGTLGAAMLTIDGTENPSAAEITLAAQLYGAVVCVDGVCDERLIAAVTDTTGFVFALCDREGAPPESDDYTILRRVMPAPDALRNTRMLTSLLGDRLPALTGAMQTALGRLGPGQTERFARRLLAECAATGDGIDEAVFERVLREQGGPDLMGSGHTVTLSDLVLPCELSRQMRLLCDRIRMRDMVYQSWGFAKKIPWGRGISALFYGAPGTGKTMAAAAVAHETGLPLLRVDIARLMSKYIGETQKNIGKIFDEAARTDSILFFDEADAIFARRTESADAQDKYANAETAYLLQRMEGYDGVTILATNLLQNFDEAFRRRIGVMLHFPMPDMALREWIWRGIFPEKAPLGTLDYTLLAKLELSGASIKNCALYGAYLAAIAGGDIAMEHLFEGVRNEYQKLSKTITTQMAQMLSM